MDLFVDIMYYRCAHQHNSRSNFTEKFKDVYFENEIPEIAREAPMENILRYLLDNGGILGSGICKFLKGLDIRNLTNLPSHTAKKMKILVYYANRFINHFDGRFMRLKPKESNNLIDSYIFELKEKTSKKTKG